MNNNYEIQYKQLAEAEERGRLIGVAEERLRVARKELLRLQELAAGGAFVIGTYDAQKNVEHAEALLRVARSRADV